MNIPKHEHFSFAVFDRFKMNVAHLDFPLLSISQLSDASIHLLYYFTTSCLVSDAPSFGTGWSWNSWSEALLMSCAGCKLERLLPDGSINDWMRDSRSFSTALVPRSGLLSHTRISESTEKALCLWAPVSRAIAMATWWLWSIMRWLEGDGRLLSERRPVLSHFSPGASPSLKVPSLKAFVMWPATLSLPLDSVECWKFSAVSSDQ